MYQLQWNELGAYGQFLLSLGWSVQNEFMVDKSFYLPLSLLASLAACWGSGYCPKDQMGGYTVQHGRLLCGLFPLPLIFSFSPHTMSHVSK